MLKPDIQQIATLMNRAVIELAEEGLIKVDKNADINTAKTFGFSANDVEGIHTHKIGVGDGVWYRLKDGRVFNNYGEPSEEDPSLYDTVEN